MKDFVKEAELLKVDKEIIDHLIKVKKREKIVEVKDEILYIENSYVDLNEDQYKGIKAINIEKFSIDILNYYLRYNVDITFSIPTYFELSIKKYLFENKEKLDRVHFNAGGKILSVSDIEKLDETMDLMVSDIKESNLSPYEKFLAVYNIVKSYKPYKNDIYDRTASRSVYSVIVSDYAVCVGYVRFLNELLRRISIESEPLSCVDKGINHSISISYIKDSNYGFNGFLLSDPTGDVIEDDYKQKTLIQNYRYSNFTFDEGMDYFTRISAAPFFLEINPNKMLEYMKGKFGKLYFEIGFNDYLKKELGEDGIYEDDEPLSIFKELLDEIGYDDYDIEDARKTISFIQERIKNNISYENKLEAIYNVNKFINQDNISFTDFVCDNLSIVNLIGNNNQLFEKVKSLLRDKFDDNKMKGIVNLIKEVSPAFLNISLEKVMNNNNGIMEVAILQDLLFETGVLPYEDKLLVRNSLINCDLESMENDILKYDERLNALYIDRTHDIDNMTFKEFKDYLSQLIISKRK